MNAHLFISMPDIIHHYSETSQIIDENKYSQNAAHTVIKPHGIL